jgi:hypothetical protein
MAARQQLIEALPEAATRAFGARSDVEGMVSCDGDVLVRLTGIANEASAVGLEGSSSGPEAWPAPSVLLRMGLLADRQVFAANWDALSHVLVAAPSGHGADAVLEALLPSLVARRSPAELGLIVIGRPHSLPDELLGVAHVLERPVDPHDVGAALEVIQLVRHELDCRMANGQTEQPDIVLVVPELADLSAEHQVALGAVMLHGPRYRVRPLTPLHLESPRLQQLPRVSPDRVSAPVESKAFSRRLRAPSLDSAYAWIDRCTMPRSDTHRARSVLLVLRVPEASGQLPQQWR